jgi:pimeloyl-ACP methyl ester carboxylesterase
VDVAPLLAARGYRVLVPYLRGYGTTRFLSPETLRNGQPSALASDCIAFMDSLEIETAVVAGFDWGARTANIVAALWPKRCKAMVSVSGYLIGSREANKTPLPPQAELEWWYQYYFATDRGRAGYDKYRYQFAKLIWQTASPKWRFDDAAFDRTAKAFDNPDHVSIVIHNYTAISGARLYWENKLGYFNVKGVSIPVAVSSFPDDIDLCPRSWAERAYPKLIHYNKLDKGGHFAAWEQPQLLSEEVRAGFRSLRH